MWFKDDHTDGQVTIKNFKKLHSERGRKRNKQKKQPAKLIPGNSDLTLYH